MLTSTFDDEKKLPITQQVGSEDGDYHHHHQQGVDSLQDEEEDKAAEKRVLRKIDLIVLPMVRTSYLLIDEPMPETTKFILQLTKTFFSINQKQMCLVFFTQYLDKQSLSYASVYGLLTDLHLTSHQFSWLTSCFYLAQLASEGPFIYLMSRFPIAKFVALTVIVWGGVCMCLAAPQNFAGFAAVRCLLGFAEGAVSPAFITITSIWYKKEEHPLRVGMWVGFFFFYFFHQV